MSVAYNDSFSNRYGIVKVDSKEIGYCVSIASSLPLMVSNDKLIEDCTYAVNNNVSFSSDTPGALVANEKYDEADRFVFITKCESTISKLQVELYYDKKYEDIIVVPDSTTAKFLSNHTYYYVHGLRVGTGTNIALHNTGYIKLHANDNADRCRLPKAKSSISSKVRAVAIPGMIEGDVNRSLGNYTEKLDDKVSISRKSIQMTTLLELGTVSDLFEETDKGLPLYVLRQFNTRLMGLEYLGVTDTPADSKLYLPLNF